MLGGLNFTAIAAVVRKAAFLPRALGAVPRPLYDKVGELVFSVKDFGAVGDGVVDDYAAIVRAIAACVLAGGGTVYFPQGTYLISAVLTIGNSDVKLIGAGIGSFHYTGTTPVSASILKWGGAAGGTMVSFDPAGVQWLSGGVFDGIYLHPGTSVAAIGVFVKSHIHGRFILTGHGFSTTIGDFTCDSALSTDTPDAQQNYIEVHGQQNGNTDGHLLRVDGIATANFSFNRIGFVDGNYKNNAGIKVLNADNNIFEHVRLFRDVGGTADGITLCAGAVNQSARNNLFLDCSPGAGGVTAQGTGSGAEASNNNYILFYDTPNSAPPPVFGTAASLYFINNSGTPPLVAARDNSGTSYGAGPTDVSWSEEAFDLGGNFASPSFTAPKTAKYRFKWTLTHTAGITVGSQWIFYITLSTGEQIGIVYYPHSALSHSVNGEAIFSMLAGQTVKLTIERTAGAGNFPLVNDTRFNRLEINQVVQGF